jgi:hypothetical protein
MKIKRPSLAASLAGVEKRDVSKAAAAQSRCRVKLYFTDWPVNTLLACFLTWVGAGRGSQDPVPVASLVCWQFIRNTEGAGRQHGKSCDDEQHCPIHF